MTYEQVNTLISAIATAIKCEYAYSAFKSGKRSRFLIFYYDDSDNFFADGTTYADIENLVIEYYSPNKDIKSEKTIQSLLTAAEIPYQKASVYINDEALHMTRYDTEVLING